MTSWISLQSANYCVTVGGNCFDQNNLVKTETTPSCLFNSLVVIASKSIMSAYLDRTSAGSWDRRTASSPSSHCDITVSISHPVRDKTPWNIHWCLKKDIWKYWLCSWHPVVVDPHGTRSTQIAGHYQPKSSDTALTCLLQEQLASEDQVGNWYTLG